MVVIAFHFNFLPNGYLGVDMFFVISGYLITLLNYKNPQFSILTFYRKRALRILPLILISSMLSLVVGIFVMLPDDLENLGQSVFATNLFVNNYLLSITSGFYWNIVNEYKPLMHTWSLAIEEQFYIVYPLLLFVFGKIKTKYMLFYLLIIFFVSLGMNFYVLNPVTKFYHIQYRIYELSAGAIIAIIPRFKFQYKYFQLILLLSILVLLLSGLQFDQNSKLATVVILTALFIYVKPEKSLNLFHNPIIRLIGKISFSLYVWHQILLAFSRYFLFEKIQSLEAFFILIFILIISTISYYFIEIPFIKLRKDLITKYLVFLLILFILNICSGFYIYKIGGIVKDIPELNIYKSKKFNSIFSKSSVRIHGIYNDKIHYLNKSFTNSKKVKVLIIGNSFARDWANVLLESNFKDQIEISYVFHYLNCVDLGSRIKKADIVFISEKTKTEFAQFKSLHKIDENIVWNIGTKSFGANNGFVFNKNRNVDYFKQKVKLNKTTTDFNNQLEKEWGIRYINLLEIISINGEVPVFTPKNKYISQDGKHLTKDGAVYFAQKCNLSLIFTKEIINKSLK